MSGINPFNVSDIEIGNLSPRRKQYIQQRNVAQDERINDIAAAIIKYQEIIQTVQERYRKSELEDQTLIKPYLMCLYFEIGQLFEEQEKIQDALRYYEHAGKQGHFLSVECAKRLGSKVIFPPTDKVFSGNLSDRAKAAAGERAFCKALHSALVLITGENQKGSGVLARHDELGYVLMTVKHVVGAGATACIGKKEIPLDDLDAYENGSDILLFILNDVCSTDEESISIAPANIQLEIGEKVYFGGYPFKETGARLHMGHISYVGIKGEIGIDGAAVPGMSGGPIAVKRNGKFFIVGAVASETFDPIEGFSKALDKMYIDQSDAQIRYEHDMGLQNETWEWMKQEAQFTKITRDNLFIGALDYLRQDDPECFHHMWDDLNSNGVISEEGEIDVTRIVPGHLGLREAYQQYEEYILERLRKSTTDLLEMNPESIQLPFETERPTDSINTVSLSLIQSLSTGLITGHLFQEFHGKPLSLHEEKSTELEIGRKNRVEKIKKKQKQEAKTARAAAKREGTFQNNGIPPILYRFVSNEAAKDIKKNGIVHSGSDLDEIHFMTQPVKHLAQSVGAVTSQKMVTVYTDRIPNITRDNVRKVSERNHIGTYRINMSIPSGAIEISEAS
ncbi:S1 family peptidase [Simkania negevensis]|uniref:Uncharacterized protein n=1 Tax=Simkania negevensis (strain ATCC VR-1471 / DSM 27360 / Z) TaxID=331113 RepID=F8L8S7_SIMNZ|nr:serine protease [Simkania negevensis]CCB89220.1 unknown protein [Simkania negevensis Z]